MKKVLYLISLLMIVLSLYGCPPKERPGMDLLSNNYFDNNVSINHIAVYQEDYDVLVLQVDYSNHYLSNFYIKGNSLDILGAEAFGYSLDKTIIEGNEYYVVDLDELEIDDSSSFLLKLTFSKDSIYQNIYYEKIVESKIVAHSFDVFINYDKDKNEGALQNYRFILYDEKDYNYDIGDKVIVYNNLDEFLENNAYYHKLYLPFKENEVTEFSKEIIYYPNNENSLFLKADNLQLRVWVSDRGIAYGDQEKIPYVKNGFAYAIISHDNAAKDKYSVDFMINESEKIQYSYLLEGIRFEEVKAFIDAIHEYTLNT